MEMFTIIFKVFATLLHPSIIDHERCDRILMYYDAQTSVLIMISSKLVPKTFLRLFEHVFKENNIWDLKIK